MPLPRALRLARGRARLRRGAHAAPGSAARYRDWRAAVDAKQLTLVFASAYLNNPGSMYGHTLLRVDAADQDERTRLLAYTISFAADTNETNGLVFAVKGLLGGYAGVYSMLPYYVKVREYGDLENRDLWEYELDFSAEEIERVLRHAWELLPGLLRVLLLRRELLVPPARPAAGCAAGPRADRAVPAVGAAGRYGARADRAARAGAANHLPPGELDDPRRASRRHAARGATHGQGPGTRNAGSPATRSLRALPPERAAAVIEAGYDYLNYRRTTGVSEVPDGGALARELLVARSAGRRTLAGAAHRARGAARPGPPHLALERRAPAGATRGLRRARRCGATYHDIVDDDAGYIGGAQIEFFNLRARRYERSDARIESFIPVEIFSLSPRDEFFQPRSCACRLRLAAHVHPQRRRAARDRRRRRPRRRLAARAAARASTRPRKGAARAHDAFEKGYTLGAGARLGALIDPAPRWRVHAYAQQLGSFAASAATPARSSSSNASASRATWRCASTCAHQREAGRSFSTGLVSLQLYF